MSRVTTFIYGLVIAFVALDAMIFGIIPAALLPFVLMVLGVMIFLTPIVSMPAYNGPGGRFVSSGKIGPRYQWLRRYVFGIYIVAVGVLSLLGFAGQYVQEITIYTLPGQLILLLIGVIYFLATFGKTRNIQIASY